jgi:preprotein translocase subunit Sss1
MPLGLAVFLVVLAGTAVVGLVGYLVNRSAEINEHERETK